MKLLSLEIGQQFRSLHPGFKVEFHIINNNGLYSINQFHPFCFAGLNGSGKSNVLEALAAIFYHLEMCVAKYRPDSCEKHFSRSKSTPDAFRLEYLINPDTLDSSNFSFETAVKVTIIKVSDNEPEMYVQEKSGVDISKDIARVSMMAPRGEIKRSVAKIYLPDLVVGYSSGENEILSLPFIKNRLVHFDEYKENVKQGIPFDEPETSLLYIDKEMSQAVLLACMLYEDPETTLKPLRDELGIVGIQSFRMNLNNQALIISEDKKGANTMPILLLESCSPKSRIHGPQGQQKVICHLCRTLSIYKLLL